MVVDDHPMWRDAVARDLTEAGYDVVATAADGAQALRVASAARPDVVVLDLRLPDMSGVEVTRGLQAAHPAVRVLVLSASGEQQDVLDAVKAGALGYLLKSAARAELLDAVRRTASGDAVFTPGLAALVLGEFRRLSAAPAAADSGLPRLSERETEILRMVATGLSYKQIASRLVLSPRTVQNHVQNTLGKLQLHNRVELVRYAIEHGLAGEFEAGEAGQGASLRSSHVLAACAAQLFPHDLPDVGPVGAAPGDRHQEEGRQRQERADDGDVDRHLGRPEFGRDADD